VLEVRSLSVDYGPVRGLDDVSIRVGPDEIVAIIGSNGAGKSTLLNAISGLVPVAGGKIFFLGEDVTRVPPDRRVALGLIQSPEGRRLFSSMTVLENLQMGAYVRYRKKGGNGVAGDLDRILELFPVLTARKRQIAGTLSGGEQQMLALGRALMGDPRLLLMDEPSLGLAPLVVKEIFRVIRELRGPERSILLVEQNAREALMSSLRAYVLEIGSLRFSGSSPDLCRDPRIKEAFLGKRRPVLE
jgi:branched-chain amino acid transport system ATP-binding protein